MFDVFNLVVSIDTAVSDTPACTCPEWSRSAGAEADGALAHG